MHIEIFGKATCPWCKKAVEVVKAAKVDYTYHIIGEDGLTRDDVQAKIKDTGSDAVLKTVPQIIETETNTYIGGYTDLVNAFPWAKIAATQLGYM